MCIVDTVKEENRTFTAFCYCGWSTDEIESKSAAADSIAQKHADKFAAENPPVV